MHQQPWPKHGGVVILTTLKVPKTGGIPTTKASVLRWLKHEGDIVKVGEAVVELETEKVSYELESPIAGVLLKIVAGESVQVPVGGPLCHIGQPDDLVPAGKE
ncbi:MAG: lipoyl domain-containing protein [Candidatus Sulfotelmatobacter sp.]|jgi:pyruvate/2-oxoglutarate dehydrogenase complex dihydrolipoamide acyltransferase (E2) component